MSPKKLFLKDGLQDNNQVVHSLMKTFYAVSPQKRKALREGNRDEIDNFEMWILDEGVQDKALEGLENTLDGVKPGRQFMRSSTINITNKSSMFLILFLFVPKSNSTNWS